MTLVNCCRSHRHEHARPLHCITACVRCRNEQHRRFDHSLQVSHGSRQTLQQVHRNRIKREYERNFLGTQFRVIDWDLQRTSKQLPRDIEVLHMHIFIAASFKQLFHVEQHLSAIGLSKLSRTHLPLFISLLCLPDGYSKRNLNCKQRAEGLHPGRHLLTRFPFVLKHHHNGSNDQRSKQTEDHLHENHLL